MNNNLLFDFPRVLGTPLIRGAFRSCPEDFKVCEKLSFTPTGEGDHLYLFIEKTLSNTDWVAELLAKLAGLKAVDVGYAGLKDRQAITRQWFSLHLPNQPDPDFSSLPPEIRILTSTRHNKKLRSGAIEHNQFEIKLRDLDGDKDDLQQRLLFIQAQGFPNYFGAQRFGFFGSNVHKLLGLQTGRRRVSRHQKGLYISSGRSYLFNHVLARRVQQNNWNKAIDGDVMMLAGSRSLFVPQKIDDVIVSRIEDKDIHPGAMLYGRGELQTSDEAQKIESEVLGQYPTVVNALEKAAASIAYRSMRALPDALEWQISDHEIKLTFSLLSGSYATSLLNEVVELHEPDNQE